MTIKKIIYKTTGKISDSVRKELPSIAKRLYDRLKGWDVPSRNEGEFYLDYELDYILNCHYDDETSAAVSNNVSFRFVYDLMQDMTDHDQVKYLIYIEMLNLNKKRLTDGLLHTGANIGKSPEQIRQDLKDAGIEGIEVPDSNSGDWF
jgi:hypothetical protein